MKKAKLQRWRTDQWLPEVGCGRAKWVKRVKSYKLPVINKSWGCNAQHGDYS